MAEPEKQETKARRQYLGRRALLNIINEKSPSTKKWLVKMILGQMKAKQEVATEIRMLAKKRGLRIGKLELR